MKKLMLLSMFLLACNDKSKLDSPEKNVARENALISFEGAKCDETGFQTAELHSVRCTLKNGTKVYCTAGITGTGCTPIYVPEEVQKQAQAAQQAANAPVPPPPSPAPAPPAPTPAPKK